MANGNGRDIVQKITGSAVAGWLAFVLSITGCYWYIEGALQEMHNIEDSIQTAFKLEKLRDDGWLASDLTADALTEELHLAIRDDQGAILSKLSENNGIMQSLLSATMTMSYNMGVYQGHHEDDIGKP